MKKTVFPLIVLALLASATACRGTSKKTEATSVDPTAHPYASYEKLSALVSGKDSLPYLLLDVRTAEEYADGHIPGAVLLPYDRIGPGQPDAPKDKLVIVYCRSGRRSALAAESLKKLGFADIADFGAVTNWTGRLEK